MASEAPSRSRRAAARARRGYLVLAVLLVPLGLGTKACSGPASAWARDHGAGMLYVAFWVFAALALRPRWSPGRVALVVLALTCALELLQTVRHSGLARVRATWLGDALLGTTFDPRDLPYYGAGALLAWGAASALRPGAGGPR